MHDQPDDVAETKYELANQLQALANDVPGSANFDEVDVRFYRCELRTIIVALRGGSDV